MKITNKHNLPLPFVNAARMSLRRPSPEMHRQISVTTLIKPPRIVALERQHWDDLEIDAMELAHSIMGTAVHHVLGECDEDALAKEERFWVVRHNWAVSGQIDRLTNDGVLQDYKMTSVWSVIYGKTEWEQQLNLYALLLRYHGYTVERLEIIAFLRDWNRMGALKHDYPQTPVVGMLGPTSKTAIPIQLWPEAVAWKFLDERLALHVSAIVDLPECSPEERWAKPDTWAAVKKGNKNASRVLPTEAEAKIYVGDGAKYEIQHRRGDSNRCRSYCSVSAVCSQWAKLKEELDHGTDDNGQVRQSGEAGQEIGVD